MDDTLVDRESVYIHAQETLLGLLRKLDSRVRPKKDVQTLRKVDCELVRLHGWKYMYNSTLLVYGLWYFFHEGKSARRAARLAMVARPKTLSSELARRASARYDAILKRADPPLLRDARSVLRRLKKRYVLVLFPSGRRDFQLPVIHHHGLDKIFDAVLIVQRKDTGSLGRAKELGLRIFRKAYKSQPRRIVVVGDRISTDILPGKKIGAETIWIPGPYYPGTASKGVPDHMIRRLGELPSILLAKE